MSTETRQAAVVVCLFTNQSAKVEILGEDLSSNSRAVIVFYEPLNLGPKGRDR
jgi:hypothetical protein